MKVETIKIKCDNELGYRFINLSDYFESVDELFKSESESEPEPEVVWDEKPPEIVVKKPRAKKG